MILFKSFPDADLLVDAILLYAAEVETRNDPDDLAIIDDGQVTAPAVFHEP